MTYSPDHAAALQGVMDTIGIIARQPEASEDELVEALQAQGYSRVDAEKLNVFVPSALAWIVLKQLGLAHLPDHFLAADTRGQLVEIPVADQHYFTAALNLAYSTFENGWSEDLPRSAYEAVAARSAEMGIANNVLNQGGSLEGATLQPLQLLRLYAEHLLAEAQPS